ncbi:MAG: Xaa-Pro peptidase family protein [Bacillota bacterium]
MEDRNLIFSTKEFGARLAYLKEEMKRNNIEIGLILHHVNLYYFSGISLHSALIVPLGTDPILLVQINLERAKRESWVTNVSPSRGFSSLIDVIKKLNLDKGNIGLEMDIIPAGLLLKLQQKLPDAFFVDLAPVIFKLRIIKSHLEVEFIKKAAEISARSFEHCKNILDEGMSEIELQAEIVKKQYYDGAEGVPYLRDWNQEGGHGVFASGENTCEISGYWMCETGKGLSPAFPYGPSERKIKKGDLVCINKGVVYKGYHCDEARTFVVGAPTQKQIECYDYVQKALDLLIKTVKPGIKISELYLVANRYMSETPYHKYFMTKAFYDYEFIGHGLGLELNEPPLLTPGNNTPLQPGMVLALEPKIIIPGWGGIDIEDTVVVTEDGCEVLTLSAYGL